LKASDVIIFCGPSISHVEVKGILPGVQVCPPIKRGDLKPEAGKVYGIIDGFFHGSLTVSPQEISKALKAGSKVWGSSSMGALRAAECDRIGMIGVGKIYEKYKSGQWQEDDEVALAVENLNPEAPALSESLADIRFFLENEKLNESVSQLIIENLKAVFFAQRNFQSALETLAASGKIPESLCQELSVKFSRAPKQKHLDAKELLRKIKEVYFAA